MAKGQRRAAQPSEEPQNQHEMPEGEPQVDLGEEEMDAESFKNLIAAMNVEKAALRANQENMAETTLLQQRKIDRKK